MTTHPSDIVEQLRSVDGTKDAGFVIDLCWEAAAEIERLRAALADVKERCAKVADKYREMSCESADKALEKGDIDEHQEHAGDASIAKYIAASIRALE